MGAGVAGGGFRVACAVLLRPVGSGPGNAFLVCRARVLLAFWATAVALRGLRPVPCAVDVPLAKTPGWWTGVTKSGDVARARRQRGRLVQRRSVGPPASCAGASERLDEACNVNVKINKA